MITQQQNRLCYHFDAETLWVEAWGPSGLRVRATREPAMPARDWALLPAPAEAQITLDDEGATIVNGKLRCRMTKGGKLTFLNENGTVLLEEYVRNRRDLWDPKCSALEVEAREFRPIIGGPYRITARWESLDPHEHLYGMGQYQHGCLDLKGLDLELAQRNSQASVPFVLSSRGYGLLWNNPAVGRAVFGKNVMTFEAASARVLDYWVTAGDTPAEIEEHYAAVTGTVPMMPEYGLGFWQCKLRYQTQEELLQVAREYKRRGLPLDLIVIDFFHWPRQGEWKFDPTYWPDPAAMVHELKEMGVELMVSVWPTVEPESENYPEMLEKGYLIRTERGVRTGLDFQGPTIHIDVTNPDARDFLWQKLQQNYYRYGIRTFWLDEAEPEYARYDFDNYRYALGTDLEVGNCYPVQYSRAVFEGQQVAGQQNPVNLVRCTWAGGQRYGALVWSGDIASSFGSMRAQLAAGLSMGLAGIPWWTSDIGGFHGGDPRKESFRELFARWFAWGAFCPVMRLHGDRDPKQPPMGTTGGAACASGADNEVWSYGERVYGICRKYLALREQLRDYLRDVMQQAHEKGTPVMRTLFYEFPQDSRCWQVEDEYLFGPDYLVAPVLEAGVTERRVYLPAGATWHNIDTGEEFAGGQTVTAPAPWEILPVFRRQA